MNKRTTMYFKLALTPSGRVLPESPAFPFPALAMSAVNWSALRLLLSGDAEVA
jgi:hypothetical protein